MRLQNEISIDSIRVLLVPLSLTRTLTARDKTATSRQKAAARRLRSRSRIMAEDIKTAMIVNAAKVKESAGGLLKSKSSGNLIKAVQNANVQSKIVDAKNRGSSEGALCTCKRARFCTCRFGEFSVLCSVGMGLSSPPIANISLPFGMNFPL